MSQMERIDEQRLSNFMNNINDGIPIADEHVIVLISDLRDARAALKASEEAREKAEVAFRGENIKTKYAENHRDDLQEWQNKAVTVFDALAEIFGGRVWATFPELIELVKAKQAEIARLREAKMADPNDLEKIDYLLSLHVKWAGSPIYAAWERVISLVRERNHAVTQQAGGDR